MSNNLATSASLLDASTNGARSSRTFNHDSEGHGLWHFLNSAEINNTKQMNKSRQDIIELYETEKKFANILHSIIYVKIFKL
jgi:hypothetical protein